jgi:hypothetical protein
MTKIIFYLFVFILFSQFVSADVISVNSGGNEGIIINPDTYIEGFFSCVPTTCTKLGYNCEDWDDGCAKTINCGSCSDGYVCTSGVCTGTGTGDTGGGGAGGETTITPGIIISPKYINLTLSFNEQTNMSQRVIQKIYITNNGNSIVTLYVSQTGLDSVAILSASSIAVSPGETKEFSVDFISPLEEKDISGNIIIDGKTIPVFIHVTSNPLWFDSNIIVLNRNYQVSRGEKLRTRVELIPMGEPSRLDVTLNYIIRDALGKIYLTKSETLLIEQKMNIDREFSTGMLPIGNYIIDLQLIYPNGVAPSSAHFEVVKMNLGSFFGTLLFFIIFGILLIMILILIILIKRRKKKEESEN